VKKVLIIAYSFPPVGGAGVQRPVKFVKYLREFGWEPLVLTAENPSVPIIDESLLKDIPFGIKIFKARTLEPSYGTKHLFVAKHAGIRSHIRGWLKSVAAKFLLPDVQILWWPGMFCKLIEIVWKEKPACLFVTAPPFSSFIPAVVISKIFRVPVVVDYRDEWSFSRQQWEHAVKTPMAFWVDRILEKYTLANCCQFTAANANYVFGLNTKYPKECREKGAVITNGFDVDDFLDINLDSNVGERMVFVYAGTIWNATSLMTFAVAVKRLLHERPELASRLTIKIYGRVVENHFEYLNDRNLCGVVEFFGYVDHEKLIHEIYSSDVLLVTLADLPGAEKIIVGKVFEYMATGKHIFAVVPRGESSKILSDNYNKLTISNAGDIDDVYKGLLWIMSNDEIVRKTVPLKIDQFSRKNLTGQLATVFDNVIQGGQS